MSSSALRNAGIVLGSLGLATVATPAWAYIDPGAGSFMLQVLLGGLFATAFAVKAFWRKAVLGLTRRFRRDGRDASES